jgi:hypothetical protein
MGSTAIWRQPICWFSPSRHYGSQRPQKENRIVAASRGAEMTSTSSSSLTDLRVLKGRRVETLLEACLRLGTCIRMSADTARSARATTRD